MQISGRLKLGPKRKEIGLTRNAKAAQQNEREISSLEKRGIALLYKSGKPQNQSLDKSGAKKLSNSKNTVHQIDLTTSKVFGGNSHVNSENMSNTSRSYVKQNYDFDDIRTKNQELLAKITSLQAEKQLIEVKRQDEMRYLQHQFAIKQAQMQKAIGLLSIENDNIKNREKVLQCELQNIDKSYYEKEINRLKLQCENFQIEAAESKYQVSMHKRENQDKEKMLSSKMEDAKQFQKQMQREKLSLAQAKAQFSQKERALRIALQQSEAANQMLCNSIQEVTRQLQRQQSLKKQKSQIIQNLQQQIDTLVLRERNSQQKTVQMIRNFEEQLSIQSKKMLVAQQNQKSCVKQSQSIIQRLSSSIEDLKIQHISDLAHSELERNKNLMSEDQVTCLRLLRMQQQIKQLKLSIYQKDSIIADLQNKLKESYEPQQYMNLQKRYSQLQQQRVNQAQFYEQRLLKYQKENDQLRIDSIQKTATQKNLPASFDQIIRRTLAESESLRIELNRMTDDLVASKDEANEIKLRQKTYLNEIQILRKKAECSSKNFAIQMQVQRQKMTNEIQSLRRRLLTSQSRLEYKLNENKQKDEFIKTVIVNRTDPMDRQYIVAELQRIFLQRDKKPSSST